MRKILPMAIPDVRAYANHAHIFSILGARSSQYLPWIYNYYVQLYTQDITEEFPVDYMIPSLFTYAPNLFASRLDRKVAFDIKEGVINFLKYQINKGYYIYTCFAVNRINIYQNKFRTHDPLIYGYDDEKEEVYFADTYHNGHYAFGVASYSEITEAAGTESEWAEWGLTEWQLDVVCMKYKDLGVNFKFNKEMYVSLLLDYLQQKDSKMVHWGVVGWTKGPEVKKVLGIGIYPLARRHIQEACERRREIDLRGLYVLLEHKQIMSKALGYIWGEQWKGLYEQESRLLHEIIEEATIILNLSIKYNITMKAEITETIMRHIYIIEKLEKIFFANLIKKLEME